jgi:hypothetical protein
MSDVQFAVWAWRGILIAALLSTFGFFQAAHGTVTASQDLCDAAAATAATETGVPLAILRALSRTETGRTQDGVFAPWPWTVNNAGDGRWFDDLQSALAHAERRRAQGASNLDIGCFQINLRWHGHAFASLREMFDPLQNARYAARFLTGLHQEFGNWDDAVAAFHSRTPHFAARYMERYNRIHAALAVEGPDTAPPQPREVRPRDNGSVPPRALDTHRRPPLLSRSAHVGIPGLAGPSAVQPLWERRP